MGVLARIARGEDVPEHLRRLVFVKSCTPDDSDDEEVVKEEPPLRDGSSPKEVTRVKEKKRERLTLDELVGVWRATATAREERLRRLALKSEMAASAATAARARRAPARPRVDEWDVDYGGAAQEESGAVQGDGGAGPWSELGGPMSPLQRSPGSTDDAGAWSLEHYDMARELLSSGGGAEANGSGIHSSAGPKTRNLLRRLSMESEGRRGGGGGGDTGGVDPASWPALAHASERGRGEESGEGGAADMKPGGCGGGEEEAPSAMPEQPIGTAEQPPDDFYADLAAIDAMPQQAALRALAVADEKRRNGQHARPNKSFFEDEDEGDEVDAEGEGHWSRHSGSLAAQRGRDECQAGTGGGQDFPDSSSSPDRGPVAPSGPTPQQTSASEGEAAAQRTSKQSHSHREPSPTPPSREGRADGQGVRLHAGAEAAGGLSASVAAERKGGHQPEDPVAQLSAPAAHRNDPEHRSGASSALISAGEVPAGAGAPPSSSAEKRKREGEMGSPSVERGGAGCPQQRGRRRQRRSQSVAGSLFKRPPPPPQQQVQQQQQWRGGHSVPLLRLAPPRDGGGVSFFQGSRAHPPVMMQSNSVGGQRPPASFFVPAPPLPQRMVQQQGQFSRAPPMPFGQVMRLNNAGPPPPLLRQWVPPAPSAGGWGAVVKHQRQEW